MRKKAIVILSWVILAFAALPASAEDRSQEMSGRVDVYYFYGDFRCPTCRKLENYTKETVEKDFNPQVMAGEVVFKPVNVDKKENEHFVKEYGLYTKSVVLSLVKGGTEVKHADLDKIWEYVRDKKKFKEYVSGEIKKFLSEAEGAK